MKKQHKANANGLDVRQEMQTHNLKMFSSNEGHEN